MIKFIIPSVFFLIFLLGPEVLPDNFQFQEILENASNADVVIVYNSGGWGDTSFESSSDFAPIIKGMQETLGEWGYKSVVVPYIRTKDDFWGRLFGVKDFFSSFEDSSEILAKKIELIAYQMPEKKIIIAGLSNGAAFASEAYEKISDNMKESVYGIALGVPFWFSEPEGSNILILDNKGKDALARGDIKNLGQSFLKAPFKWISAKISGYNLAFSKTITASGHEYLWSSPEVGPQITVFLEEKFR